MVRFIALLFLFSPLSCHPLEQDNSSPNSPGFPADNPHIKHQGLSTYDQFRSLQPDVTVGSGGALILTSFKSLEELKEEISIEYSEEKPDANNAAYSSSLVRLYHSKQGKTVVSELMTGINEKDIVRAKDGGLWDKIKLAVNCPYFVIHRNDCLKVLFLSRRRHATFGGGDVAFYDLALAMLHNIVDDDLMEINSEDLSEKGFINTFNHVTNQALMTSLFSERFADFIADTHERTNLKELITGNFTKEQLTDLEYGPVDNYVDIINNEWGQELGKSLKLKHKIDRNTFWSPELLAAYLNDVQSYYSWNFKIGFKPFLPSDKLVIKFSIKINKVMGNMALLKGSHIVL
ncbi:MAG: hypothetical protein AAFZ15_33695 [Bacteroidota bacterium]